MLSLLLAHALWFHVALTSSMLAPPDAASIGSNISELASDAMNGRSFRSVDGKTAASWVATKLAQAGATPLAGRTDMQVPIARMPEASPNVVAWLAPKGANPSGEFILVTAHYDHLPNARGEGDIIYNGADDNASGVCGMIAVCEALRDEALDVGVVFVGFTGEESGMVGSRAFVEEETLPISRMRGVFNMDMISRQPDGAIRLDGGPTGKVLVDLLVRLAPSVPIEMKVDTHPDWLQRSDQGSFLAAGIPAVLFSCEDHEDYHKVTDHADKVDSTLAAKTATLVTAAVRAFSKEMTPRFDLRPLTVDALTAGTRTLRIGRSRDFAPYWNVTTRRMKDRGLDADIWTELAKRLGWKVQEKIVNAKDLPSALTSGEIDVIADGYLVITGENQPFELTRAYLTADGMGALLKMDSTLTTRSDFSSQRFAFAKDSSAEMWAHSHAAKAALTAMTTPIGTIASSVEKGEVDGAFIQYSNARARAIRDPAFRAIKLDSAPSVYAMRTENRLVVDAISSELAAMEGLQILPTLRAKYGFPAPHSVIGQDFGRVTLLDADGTVKWETPCPHNSHDLAVLANGNFLLHPAPNKIIEITREKKIVWEWTSSAVSPYTGAVEIHGFQRLADGNTMIAETGNLRIIEVDASGAIVKSVPLTVERPDAHRDTRRVRKTDAGTYLVCHEGLGLVREYDATGAIIWEFALDLNNQPATGGHDGHGTSVFNALRLKNGNTLIAGGNNNRVLEVTPDKKVVWSIERDELRREDGRVIHLCWVTSLQVLPNGNIIFGNTHAGPDNPQMIEVTRDKRVVWTLDNWDAFGNDLCTGWCTDLEGTVIR